MDLKIIDISEQNAVFVVENISVPFANTLRRTMTNEIPTMAVEYVDFEENDSAMFDEVIASRLGLVPLTFNTSLYKMKDDCTCRGRGCSKCEVVLALEKTGPCTVKAGDLKSSADDVKPVDPEIPIMELLENQRLKLQATAQLGLGIKHAKHKAAVVGYRNLANVRIKNEKCNNCGVCIDVCPKHIFVKKDGKVGTSSVQECILCMKCVNQCGNEAVSVSANENAFVFSVETVSGLSVREIVEQALDKIEKTASTFVSKIKKTLK